MYDYIILTAAVTRPDLHRAVIPSQLELVGSSRVKWLVNVDDVGGASVDDTVAQLARLLARSNVDVEFLPQHGGGCFFQAARRLAERAHDLLDQCRTGVVWLEDDWICPRRSWPERVLSGLRLRLARDRIGRRIRRCPGDLAAKQAALERVGRSEPDRPWFVSLVPRSRVSFNPGIWSKVLFEQAFRGALVGRPVDAVDDPESLCADPLNEPAAYRRLTVLVDPLFQDAGRRWSAARGIRKWDKLPPALRQRGAVTYAARGGGVQPVEMPAAAPCGWIVIPGAVVGIAPALLGKIDARKRALSVRLLGVPYTSVELMPSGEHAAEVYLHRPHRWARTYPFKHLPGRVRWRLDDPVVIEVSGPGYRFTSEVTRSMPWRALCMGPLQAVAGLAVLLGSLLATLIRLDAERPKPAP